MQNDKTQWLKWIFLSALLTACIVGGIYWWQESNKIHISGNAIFSVPLEAHPRMHDGLSSVSVDLSVPSQLTGTLLFRLRRLSLGKTSHSYPWDWKAGSYDTKDFSFIDLSKMLREDGAITACDIDMAIPGVLRVKVWRDEGEQWRVVAQSEISAAVAGLNHFNFNPALPVRKGDYIGLYTKSGGLKLVSPTWVGALGGLNNQHPINLSLSANRCLQYNFPGDVAIGLKDKSVCAPNPGYSYKFYLNGRPFQPAAGTRAEESLPVENPQIEELTATLTPRLGRGSYRFELPYRLYSLDEQVELSIEPMGMTQAFLYPSVFSGLIKLDFVKTEYGNDAALTMARVVSGSYRFPLSDILMMMVVGWGSWVLLKRRRTRWEFAGAALPVIAAVVIWKQWCTVGPLASLLPAIYVMLVLPGFVVLELALPKLASRLDALERPPLLFGLSVGVWTLVAALAYPAQWSSDSIIMGAWGGGIAGLLGVLFFRTELPASYPVSVERRRPDHVKRAYIAAMMVLIVAIAGIMAFCTQFQMSDYDAMLHLAGHRNVADSARVINADSVLGPGSLSLPQYTNSSWFLVGGLTARQAHADVTWLFVLLTFLLTVIVFLNFYSLLMTLLSSWRLAVTGIMLGSGFWIYSMVVEWRIFWSFFLTFLPFASTVAMLVLLPLSLLYALRYVISNDGEKWVATAILAAATMSIHLEFLVHVPYILGTMLLASIIPPDTCRNRMRTLALVGTIILSAAIIVSLWVNSPMRAPVKPTTEAVSIQMWMAQQKLWRLGDNLYAANLPEYILNGGWKVLLGLAVVILFIGFQIKINRDNWPVKWRKVFLLVPRPAAATRRLVVATATAVLSPWLLVFNPVVMPWLVRLLDSSVPFYRMLWTAGTFSQVIQFGGLACAVSWVLNRIPGKQWACREAIFLVLILLSIGVPLVKPSVREAVIGAVGNYGWYPSLLDSSRDSLYRSLSQLKPGAVAVSAEHAIRIAAFTPLDPIYVAGDRIGDYHISEERRAATQKILTFELNPSDMRSLLKTYLCRYVIIQVGSPHLVKFKSHPELFSEVLKRETDVVFAVNP